MPRNQRPLNQMRGGKREGAGRKGKGNHLSPRAIGEIKEKIKADWIIRKLHTHIEKGCMEASAVTAALGLLRKVVPDMQAVDLEAELANNRGIRDYTDAELLAIVARSGEGDSAEAVRKGLSPMSAPRPLTLA